jgi:hypothetical protein
MSVTPQISIAEESPELQAAREQLVSHPLYVQLTSQERVGIFMTHHVFAVWDFFSLLKRLQSEVSCVAVPWMPRGLGDHARFITEIVIAEECDEGYDGGHLSHFELYLQAMDEVGADRRPIESFIAAIESGTPALQALNQPEIPRCAREFVKHTLSVATGGQLHEVAASFCHGRENLLPDVLGGARDGMSEVLANNPVFSHYLERHITLDHDEHGPLALRLLSVACDGDRQRIADADRVAIEAVDARSRLWDGILVAIQDSGS